MAYIPPPEPGTSTPAPASLASVITTGAAVAIACAFAVGLFGGITRIESAWAAILLGWLVGLAIGKKRCDPPAAIGGALIALAGSALASVIAVTMLTVKEAHVPLAVVLAHMPVVISAMPHVIGWPGFLCWALSACLGWVTISRAARQRPVLPRATAPGGPGQQPVAGGPQSPGPLGNPVPGGPAEPGFGPEGKQRP